MPKTKSNVHVCVVCILQVHIGVHVAVRGQSWVLLLWGSTFHLRQELSLAWSILHPYYFTQH